MSDDKHEEMSSGPIKTAKQFFWTAFLSFVAPFFVIVGLVVWIASANSSSPGATDIAAKTEARIQPVSTVVLKDSDQARAEAEAKSTKADEPAKAEGQGDASVADASADAGAAGDSGEIDLAAGEKLYKSTCFACHGTGAAGAPKLGDKDAWAPGLDEGMDHLMDIAINGKGAMPPRGGSQASDAELQAAVQYMVNAVQ